MMFLPTLFLLVDLPAERAALSLRHDARDRRRHAAAGGANWRARALPLSAGLAGLAIISDLRPGAFALAVLGIACGIAGLVFFSLSRSRQADRRDRGGSRRAGDRVAAIRAAAPHVGARVHREDARRPRLHRRPRVQAARRRLLRQSRHGGGVDADADGGRSGALRGAGRRQLRHRAAAVAARLVTRAGLSAGAAALVRDRRAAAGRPRRGLAPRPGWSRRFSRATRCRRRPRSH